MKQVIFVGWVREGKPPVDGETTKNQYIIAELKKYCKVTVLDFYQKNRHPWIYLQAVQALVCQPNATIVFSTSAKNVYGILRFFKKLHLRRDIVHWVVGGSFGKDVLEGRYRADVFNFVKYNLVQCHGMIDELRSAGVNNARFVPNFKSIPYYPDLEKILAQRRFGKKTRFVFLSRIMPSKGCDYLLEAVRLLNEKGYGERYSVDFYGKIDQGYCDAFQDGVGKLQNAHYKGLLDLSKPAGYDTLATYDAMLFPTIHPSEGFSGVFIDAFVAALPVLVSDWAYNAEIVADGTSGMVYPAADAKALAETMEHCITGQTDLQQMARQARAKADEYSSGNVLSVDYLRSVGLMA